MSKPSLLFAASEVYPFAKSGGLADVAHSLPRAMKKEYDVDVIMPLYKFVDKEKFSIKSLDIHFDIKMGTQIYPVEVFGCKYEGLSYSFIYSALLSDKDFLYGPPDSGYEDNAIRFGIFNYAVVELLKRNKYSVAHLNDWQCALVPLLIKDEKTICTKTLYTIHNLSYQGTFEKTALKDLGIGMNHFTMEGLEFYGQVNFMKSGIAYADMITTVSPTYAKEILTPEFGCGLEGFLHHHRKKLVGIINGIDTEHFSPSDDKALIEPYIDLKGKELNKKAYLKHAGLKGLKKPLFVFIGRFTWQKGVDLLIETLPHIAALDCNISILGEGEKKYHDMLTKISDKYSNVYLEFGYDEGLAHRMYAATDFLLMPSLFEPCGLNQLISMHYGALPIVHKVGGLRDTVFEDKSFDPLSNKGYGLVFTRATKTSFFKAVKEALVIYENKTHYKKLVKHNMGCDFSWKQSAKSYKAVYKMLSK